jgi:itaconyl-CoA hydratase
MTWQLTSPGSYFEDFTVGSCVEHPRGKTIGEIDNVLITNMVMNTAQAHFNEHRTGRRVVFGGITASMVIGLAMEDTGENAIAELGLDRVRFRNPVFHGDTLYALSEVLEAIPLERPDAGEVRFRHVGFNQDGAIVFEGERRVLIRRRGA